MLHAMRLPVISLYHFDHDQPAFPRLILSPCRVDNPERFHSQFTQYSGWVLALTTTLVLSQLFPCHKHQLIIQQIPNHTRIMQCSSQGVTQEAQQEQMVPISSCTNNTPSSCSLILNHRNRKKPESKLIYSLDNAFRKRFIFI